MKINAMTSKNLSPSITDSGYKLNMEIIKINKDAIQTNAMVVKAIFFI